MSVAYPNLPVKMFSFLPGITTQGGATHQSIEDISVMRSLPNMTILECADATEVESVLDAAYNVSGPVYVRMLRGEINRLFDPAQPLKLGKIRRLSRGRDITVLSSGICTEEAMRAVKVLQKESVSIEHLHVSTLKPFNGKEILYALSANRYGVITMENHSVIGGLGSAVSEVMAEAGVSAKLIRIGIKDCFLHGASRAYLAREYGIDAYALVLEVEKIMKQKFKITRPDMEKHERFYDNPNAKVETL